MNEKEGYITVAVKQPGEAATIERIENTLLAKQKIVGGNIDIVRIGSNTGTLEIVCNDDFHGLPANIYLNHLDTILCGALIVAAWRYDDAEGVVHRSLTSAEQDEAIKLLETGARRLEIVRAMMRTGAH